MLVKITEKFYINIAEILMAFKEGNKLFIYFKNTDLHQEKIEISSRTKIAKEILRKLDIYNFNMNTPRTSPCV